MINLGKIYTLNLRFKTHYFDLVYNLNIYFDLVYNLNIQTNPIYTFSGVPLIIFNKKYMLKYYLDARPNIDSNKQQ